MLRCVAGALCCVQQSEKNRLHASVVISLCAEEDVVGSGDQNGVLNDDKVKQMRG